jgi:HlyD family secretion protein
MQFQGKMFKKLVVAGAVLGLGGLAAAGMLLGGVTEVETAAVQTSDIVQTVEDTGYVQPVDTHEIIYAAQSGRVIQIMVAIGQTVDRGQTLLTLESLDLTMQIEAAQTQLSQTLAAAAGLEAAIARTQLQLDQAREDLARKQQLLAAGAVTPVEYEQARLLVATYEQGLNEQQARLDGTSAQAVGLDQSLQRLSAKEQQLVVTSPTGGIVLSLSAEKGQTLLQGHLVGTIAAPDRLEIKADILSDDLAQVAVGQTALITAPVLDTEVLVGKVQKIYPRAEERLSPLGVIQRRVPVIITLEEPSLLKPGFEVDIAIETVRREEVLTVPRMAVRTTTDGRREVMVVVANRVQFRPVETGITDGEYIEIISGLDDGEQIVTDGGLDLAENARVKPVSR